MSVPPNSDTELTKVGCLPELALQLPAATKD